MVTKQKGASGKATGGLIFIQVTEEEGEMVRMVVEYRRIECR